MEKLNEKEEKKSKGIFEKLKNKKVTWEDIQKAFNIMDHLGEAANKLGIMLRMIQADFKGEFQIPINDKIQIGAAILYVLTTSAGLIGTGANDLQIVNGACVTVAPLGGLLAEIFFTCVFVLVVLGATSKTNGATNNFAGLAIGLALVLVHLACIRYTGTSVNPARSIGPALFQCGTALTNLWIFIVGPLAGGVLAAGIWKVIEPTKD